MGIRQRIEEDVFGLHRKREDITRVGTILNSYYDKKSIGNANIILDVAFLDDDGSSAGTSTGIPLLKQGGVAQSLPPVGALAVILDVGGNQENKICLGYIESGITSQYITDDKTPKAPPRVLYK